jgi:hypothetical protein
VAGLPGEEVAGHPPVWVRVVDDLHLGDHGHNSHQLLFRATKDHHLHHYRGVSFFNICIILPAVYLHFYFIYISEFMYFFVPLPPLKGKSMIL